VTTSTTPQQPRPFAVRHAKALVASVGVTIGFVWLMRAGGLPLTPPRGSLDDIGALSLVLSVALMLLHMLLKYARAHFLLAPLADISLRRIMTISSISMALITALPFRLGEAARPALLREKGKLSGWAVTGTVGAERIIDGVAFGLTLLLGLWQAPPQTPLPDRIGNLLVLVAMVPRAAILATSVFGVALVTMTIFFWRRDLARRLTERVVGVVSSRLATRLADLVSNLSDGFKFLPKWRFVVPYLLATLLCVLSHAWAIRQFSVVVGLAPLTLAQSCVVTGVLALGFALPNAPGFFGAVQLALYASLALYVSPEQVVHRGAALVFLFYVTYLGLIGALALISLVVEYLVPSDSASEQPAA
jgi:glycosyltransferase 2 family protein